MGGYLREIGRQAPSQLLQLATSSRPTLTKEVIAALGSHPDRRVVLLLAAFKGAWDNSIKQEAIRVLGRSTDAGAIRILGDFMKDPDEDIRVFAANCIMTMNDKALSEYIKSVVQSKMFYKKSLAERQAYLDLLGRQLNWESYDVLRDLLRQRTGLVNRKRRLETRLAVVQTLARTGGSLAREVLEEGCQMRGLKVRHACRQALKNLPRPSQPQTPPPEKNKAPGLRNRSRPKPPKRMRSASTGPPSPFSATSKWLTRRPRSMSRPTRSSRDRAAFFFR
jgi:hypothetical protein